jgi:hypothetical protein
MLLLAIVTLAMMPALGTAQQGDAVVRVVSPTGKMSASTDRIDVDIVVENVSDLGGFQFVLANDAARLKPLDAQKSQFLASSGRPIQCADPTIEAGAVRVACVTLGSTPKGVDGSGTIATVSYKPLSAGTSELKLSNVKLVHPDSSDVSSTAVGGTIVIVGSGGSSIWMWILAATIGVLVLGAVLVALWLRRARSRQPAT